MTIQNKIYECMSIGKPVITGDSPAIRRQFNHMEHIYLVERQNGRALADAVISLLNDCDTRHRIASNAYSLYHEKYNLKAQGKRLQRYFLDLVEK
jgi:glycosyltransferase involved in cell wall biosynthesis